MGHLKEWEVKVCEEIKKALNISVHGFVMLQLLILISSSQDLTFGLDVMRGRCMHELDGVWDGDQSFEVLKRGH